MPQITAIEPQKKKKDRVNIFLDQKFAFSLSDYSLLKNNLSVGQILADAQLEKIIKGEQLAKLQEAAIKILAARPRSEREVRIYLAAKIAKSQNVKFSQARESLLIEKIIAKLKKYGYLNDLDFAKWYVDSRTRSHPKGRILLKLELKGKGIDTEIISQVLEKSISETALAQKALVKKIKTWQKLAPIELKKKVYQYLAARGFDFDTIKETVANLARKS